MDPTIFLDMDGVLVDFASGIRKVHGEPNGSGELHNYDVEKFYDMSANQFWAPFDHDFWEGLGWTDEGPSLLAGIEELVPRERVVLMTSPCMTKGAVEGKVSWIRRNLPVYSRQFFVGPPKHLAAGPGKILVDDHNLNVERFAEHGGQVVLVPRPWNKRRAETTAGRFSVRSVLDELKQLLV